MSNHQEALALFADERAAREAMRLVKKRRTALVLYISAVVRQGREITGRPSQYLAFSHYTLRKGGEQVEVVYSMYCGEGQYEPACRIRFPSRWLDQPDGWQDELRAVHREFEKKKNAKAERKRQLQLDAEREMRRQHYLELKAEFEGGADV